MPITPSLEQRLAMRQRPPGRSFMRNRWEQLLFLHWQWPVAELQARLPQGLYVDTFEGQAWLGLVPFYMRRVTLSGWPAVPGFSDFLELNVRTYVHDEQGRPGVWFFSLDCNQPLAVRGARRLYHLPYRHAVMQALIRQRDGSSEVEYGCGRVGMQPLAPASYSYAPSGRPAEAAPGSLEFFLVERYALFTHDPRSGRLFEGRVYHSPYQLSTVTLSQWSAAPLAWNGFDSAGRAPDHALYSALAEVDIYGLQPLPATSGAVADTSVSV